MTTFLLIRHGMNDFVGNALAGWSPGVHLNEEGRRQASDLAARLANVKIDAIYSSPLERALQTAEPVAASHNLPVQRCAEFGEFRFGEWTGQSFEDLEETEDWKRFNTFRTGTRPPGGELMSEVQCRMVNGLEQLRRRHPEQVVAVFSHADAIRAVLAHYAGIPLDLCLRLEIRPASVSVVKIGDWGPQIVRINDIGQPL